VTGLLPQALRDEIVSRGDFGASESFGVVTLILLIVILVEHEVLRVAAPAKARMAPLFAAAVALSCAVALTIGVRIGDLIP
jgi:hypothetical protein